MDMLKIFLIVGAVGIIISSIFIGAWTNGQQQRANFHSETVVHRNFRTKIALYSGLTGVISLGIAGLIYFF
jgi:FtsZ-interacting cell division protein ZipA